MKGSEDGGALNQPHTLLPLNIDCQAVYFTDVNGEAGSPSPLNKLHCGLLAHP